MLDQFSRFVMRNARTVEFVTLALATAGIYTALTLPTSVFPQTAFPRVVILVDSGVMPADQMMATITRPIEEAMNDIPGVESIRSATSRGSAEINVFFDSFSFLSSAGSCLWCGNPSYRLAFSAFFIRLTKAEKAHRFLQEIDLSKSDVSKLDAIEAQLDSILAVAAQLKEKVAKLARSTRAAKGGERRKSTK